MRRVGDAARRDRGGAQARPRRERSSRREGRDRRDPPRRRRRRGGDLGRRRVPDADPLRGEPRLQDRAALGERERDGRIQGGRLRDQGRRRLLDLQVRGWYAPRPARAGDGIAGSDPHLDRDRRGDARGRGGRRRDRRERPEDRRLPLHRARAARASTRPTRRSGSRTCRRGSSSRCRTRSRSCRTRRRRCACCAPGSTRPSASASRRSSSAARKLQIGSGERAEKIRTYNYPDSRVTDHRVKVTVHRLEQVLPAGSTTSRRRFRRRTGAGRSRRDRSARCSAPRDASILGRDVGDTRGSTRSCCSRTRSGATRIELYTDFDRPLDEARARRLPRARRTPRTPRAVAYILGEWGFRRLTLAVDARALIPRPETEIVVERALALLRGLEAPRVLDVGTG